MLRAISIADDDDIYLPHWFRRKAEALGEPNGRVLASYCLSMAMASKNTTRAVFITVVGHFAKQHLIAFVATDRTTTARTRNWPVDLDRSRRHRLRSVRVDRSLLHLPIRQLQLPPELHGRQASSAGIARVKPPTACLRYGFRLNFLQKSHGIFLGRIFSFKLPQSVHVQIAALAPTRTGHVT